MVGDGSTADVGGGFESLPLHKMTFVLDEKECRLIADGLAALAAMDRDKLSGRSWLMLNQLGIMFKTYATPLKIEPTARQRRDAAPHLRVVKKS